VGARGRRRRRAQHAGGDYLFDCGQDLSIGHENHDADAIHLYLEESIGFRVAAPEAAVPLPA
jgi:uncharacterized linocin/CFP29 family protein